ncbi:hypothetical protein C8F01DRAFT_635111 [Mycena amicta]|nr:hypothetical protein C8F01DRAFT_635111 [Mycena amicta]
MTSAHHRRRLPARHVLRTFRDFGCNASRVLRSSPPNDRHRLPHTGGVRWSCLPCGGWMADDERLLRSRTVLLSAELETTSLSTLSCLCLCVCVSRCIHFTQGRHSPTIPGTVSPTPFLQKSFTKTMHETRVLVDNAPEDPGKRVRAYSSSVQGNAGTSLVLQELHRIITMVRLLRIPIRLSRNLKHPSTT